MKKFILLFLLFFVTIQFTAQVNEPALTSKKIAVGTNSAVLTATNNEVTTKSVVLGTNTAIPSNGVVTLTGNITIPPDAVVTSANIVFTGFNLSVGSIIFDFYVAASGAGTLQNDIVSKFANTNKTYSKPVSNLTNGIITLSIYDDYHNPFNNPAATVTSITLTYSYTTTKWYDASTGGNLLGTGNTLETVGTSVLPNTETTGTYNFYAEAINESGTSNRTQSTVTVVPLLGASITSNNLICNGVPNGSATAITSGGAPPFTYEWLPAGSTQTISGLSPGTYTLKVIDDIGQLATANVTITQPDAIVISSTHTDASCNGGNNGSATVNVTGGTGAYTYSWNTTPVQTTAKATGLASGSYIVTVTDAKGCINTATVTIGQPAAISIITNLENVSIKTNGNARYTINSTNADSFQWQVTTNGTEWTNVVDGGTEPTYSGATTNTLNIAYIPITFDNYQYRVLLTNGINCVTTSTFALLTVNSNIKAANDDFSAVVINEGTSGIAGDVTANDLLNDVLVNDRDVIINVVNDGGLTGVTIDATGNLNAPATATFGTYTVTYSICEVADITNCSSAEAIVVISPTLGRDTFKTFNVSVYPNPATKEVFVKIPEFSSYLNIKVTIYDMSGRSVRESHVTTDIQAIDISDLESGIYNFNIVSDNGTTTKRIIRNK
ncbi:T9SS type A sorting domain-containing protein [Flavobacterium sp.]|uniref:T9SS type A sorting domain-containing protein n=1 Tax=Flavobacterium sp. TaxID=239 RepID=UPI003D139D2A